ncbi:hypothetical protein L6272_03200 [Microgenomates group bacterium]|nr:hypothetical protein [Patescibacteria group bacterium]MBU1499751.1 hypothetical protein [Patescibacteria group bacterium]MCG2691810.1 hypothetical protein [Microgenomates group bacterium]
MKNELLLELYKRPETVFTLADVSIMFPKIAYENIKARMFYLAVKGMIKKVRRGIFVKDNYDVLELANKLYSPSYISLETVLAKAGITFQYYQEIFSISYLSRSLSVAENNLRYRKIRDEILLNHQGIERVNQAEMATKERAFLDAVFLYKDYHFDNLRPLDWEKIEELKIIYQSKIFNKRINDYYQIYKTDNA